MASILVRKLDANGDPLRGSGRDNFIEDIDAVAQIILTSLRLFLGEWWENMKAGVPMFQEILGSNNGHSPDVISAILKDQILRVPFVSAVLGVTTNFDATTRAFSFSCQVQTQFGIITISTNPASSATILNN